MKTRRKVQGSLSLAVGAVAPTARQQGSTVTTQRHQHLSASRNLKGKKEKLMTLRKGFVSSERKPVWCSQWYLGSILIQLVKDRYAFFPLHFVWLCPCLHQCKEDGQFLRHRPLFILKSYYWKKFPNMAIASCLSYLTKMNLFSIKFKERSDLQQLLKLKY